MDYKTTKSKIKVGSNKTNNYTEFFHKAFRNILLVSAPLTIISALILSLPHSSAYSSSTDSVALTLPSSCTISASVVTPHTITLVNGQKQDDIGNTKINAYCNDNNGYFIYAIGSSNDTAGNTDLISSVNDNYNIHTGIYPTTLTTSTPSSWAMKLSSNNGTYAPTIIPDYTNYTTIPSTDTVVAYRTSGTSMDINTDLTGSYFNTTYQIYTNSIQPAGTYLGKVKYTMTHPYNASQLPNIENAFDIAGVDKVNVPGVGNYYAMQDMTERICSLVGVRGDLSAAQLVDIRDNKLYWVAKLDDDNCWMTQNLDLDLSNSNTLSSLDTDLNSIYNDGQHPEYNSDYSKVNDIVYWRPENSTTNSGWTNSTAKPYSYDPGNVYPDKLAPQATASEHGLAGNFYNWTAIIASNDSASTSSGDMANSICPKGWRLPSYSGKELDNLLATYNIITAIDSNTYATDGFEKLVSPPVYFIRAGGIGAGGNPTFNMGMVGYSWYNTAATNGNSYTIRFASNEINTRYTDTRADGLTVRCLAR